MYGDLGVISEELRLIQIKTIGIPYKSTIKLIVRSMPQPQNKSPYLNKYLGSLILFA